MAQFSERFCFDLAYAFTRDVEHLADFLKRLGTTVLETEAKLQNIFFARCESVKHFKKLFAQHTV